MLWLDWRRNQEPESGMICPKVTRWQSQGLQIPYIIDKRSEDPDGRQSGKERKGAWRWGWTKEGGRKQAEQAESALKSTKDSHSQFWPSLGLPGEFQNYWCRVSAPEILIWLLCRETWVRGCLKAFQLSWMYSQSCKPLTKLSNLLGSELAEGAVLKGWLVNINKILILQDCLDNVI